MHQVERISVYEVQNDVRYSNFEVRALQRKGTHFTGGRRRFDMLADTS